MPDERRWRHPRRGDVLMVPVTLAANITTGRDATKEQLRAALLDVHLENFRLHCRLAEMREEVAAAHARARLAIWRAGRAAGADPTPTNPTTPGDAGNGPQ